MKVAFSTLGCRVNVYETESMMESFIKNGYTIVDFNDIADVYVINTCTVTNAGDKKSRQAIHKARKLNEKSTIAVVGCYSQIKPDEVSKIPGVDVVLGNRNKSEIVYYVNKAISEKKQIVQVQEVLKDKKFDDLSIEEYQSKTRAFLKIQDGCNRFCSYCLIPYARGASCSKDMLKIEKEVRNLAKNGFKEIILSGINISSYGKDLEGNISLLDVIKMVSDVNGIERIRIGSIDPEFFSDENIEEVSKIKKLCPHFHISLQSGSDLTLKRMNRHYSVLFYEDVVSKLREEIKDVAITTDIIVGFPGESSEEFNETYEFLKKTKLSKTHTFKYSIREGTKAALLKDQVNGVVKEERSKKIIKLNEENESLYIDKFIGKTFPVLFEEKVENNIYCGYTPNYIKVFVEAEKDITHKILKVEIVKSENLKVVGLLKDI
ncbi:MAG: tRNA (N(6)-L-threonylcarbamoyladenosine(37)-C(2))-methylthiotransferase MtaB [Clostridiaceae bacterium]